MESCCFLRLLFNIPIKETQILKLPKIRYQRISLNNCKIPVQDKTKHVYSSQFTIGSLLSRQTTLSNKKIYAPLSSKTLLTSIQPCLYVAKVGLKYHANHQRYLVKEIKHNDSSRLGRRSDVIKRVRRVLIDKKIKFNQTEERWKRNEVIKDVRRVIQDKKIKFHQTEERWKINSRLILDDIKETRSKMKTKMEEIIERENIWTVPNLLCVSRIAISPYLGYLILEQEFTLALGVLTFAGITDLLDGWIARTFKNQSSKLGSFLDPMADKILVATMFLTLTYADIIPVPLTCLIITRDVFLVGAGFVIRYKSLPPPRTLSRYFDVTHATAQLAPTTISKVNTTVQLVTVASTLAAPVFDYLHHPALVTLWYVAAGTTVASAASYILSKNTFKFLKNKKVS